MEELALKVEHVSKEYRLGQIGGGTLKAEIQSKIAKWRHKEDPNLKIGEKAHEKNERFLALDDVSFEIKKGEKIGIIGHNGAGKSTILKLICRVTAPTKGNIYLNGRITSMLEVGTGFHGELTGRENIYLNGSILGMSKAEIDEKIDEIIEFSEVKQFIDTPVKRYSSGMHVKLGFAVASHLNSEIMIMDEVLAVGDMAFQNKCIEQMKKVADEEGRTILYVSHNMNTIRQLCDRCIVLNHGTVAFIGDVEEAINIYLGINPDEIGTCIDLSNKRMEHLPKKIDCKMQEINLVGKTDAPIYDVNESLVCDLKIKSYKTIKNPAIRLEVRDWQDIPVGAAYNHKLNDFEENTENTIRVTLDDCRFIPGKYKVLLVIYEVNEYGIYYDLDAIFPTFIFEVVDRDGKLDIKWNKSAWGKICFGKLKCEDR